MVIDTLPRAEHLDRPEEDPDAAQLRADIDGAFGEADGYSAGYADDAEDTVEVAAPAPAQSEPAEAVHADPPEAKVAEQDAVFEPETKVENEATEEPARAEVAHPDLNEDEVASKHQARDEKREDEADPSKAVGSTAVAHATDNDMAAPAERETEDDTTVAVTASDKGTGDNADADKVTEIDSDKAAGNPDPQLDKGTEGQLSDSDKSESALAERDEQQLLRAAAEAGTVATERTLETDGDAARDGGDTATPTADVESDQQGLVREEATLVAVEGDKISGTDDGGDTPESPKVDGAEETRPDDESGEGDGPPDGDRPDESDRGNRPPDDFIDRCNFLMHFLHTLHPDDPRYNEVRDFRRNLLNLGDEGYNTRMIQEELLSNYIRRADDFEDRFMILTRSADTERLMLDYFCFATVKEDTFKGFLFYLNPNNYDIEEVLTRGRPRAGQPASAGELPEETGRGIALMVVHSLRCGIERIGEHGAHIWFEVHPGEVTRQDVHLLNFDFNEDELGE